MGAVGNSPQLKYNAVQLYLLVDMVDKIDDVARLSMLDNGDSEL